LKRFEFPTHRFRIQRLLRGNIYRQARSLKRPSSDSLPIVAGHEGICVQEALKIVVMVKLDGQSLGIGSPVGSGVRNEKIVAEECIHQPLQKRPSRSMSGVTHSHWLNTN